MSKQAVKTQTGNSCTIKSGDFTVLKLGFDLRELVEQTRKADDAKARQVRQGGGQTSPRGGKTQLKFRLSAEVADAFRHMVSQVNAEAVADGNRPVTLSQVAEAILYAEIARHNYLTNL